MRFKDIILAIATGILSALLLLIIMWMLVDIFIKGAEPFLVEGLKVLVANPVLSPTAKTYGGIGPMLYGTFLIVGFSVLMGLPIGFFTGLYLYEKEDSKFAKICRSFLDMLVEAPTICYGVVVYFTLVLLTRTEAAIFSSLCLTFILVPYIAIQTCDVLKTLPPELKETCYSLGLGTWRTLWVLIRACSRALVANIMVSIARILGETGPLLITALQVAYWGPWIFEPFTRNAPALTTFIYFAAFSPFSNIEALGWAACLVLTLITLTLFVIARIIMRSR